MIERGDFAICLGQITNQFTKGKIYQVEYVTTSSWDWGTIHVFKDDTGIPNGWLIENFKKIIISDEIWGENNE